MWEAGRGGGALSWGRSAWMFVTEGDCEDEEWKVSCEGGDFAILGVCKRAGGIGGVAELVPKGFGCGLFSIAVCSREDAGFRLSVPLMLGWWLVSVSESTILSLHWSLLRPFSKTDCVVVGVLNRVSCDDLTDCDVVARGGCWYGGGAWVGCSFPIRLSLSTAGDVLNYCPMLSCDGN